MKRGLFLFIILKVYNAIVRILKVLREGNKIINKKSPLFMQDLVIIKNNSYNFRYTNTAEVPRPRTSNYQKMPKDNS
jgi:hypothetical protein